jgi:RHS repeat-associated protein
VISTQTWIDAPAYDVRGDLDLDGDVDATDKSTLRDNYEGVGLGRGVLTASLVRNSRGPSGHVMESGIQGMVRVRVLHTELGRWISRDPVGPTREDWMYANNRSNPLTNIDPDGREAQSTCSGCTLKGGQELPETTACYKIKTSNPVPIHGKCKPHSWGSCQQERACKYEIYLTFITNRACPRGVIDILGDKYLPARPPRDTWSTPYTPRVACGEDLDVTIYFGSGNDQASIQFKIQCSECPGWEI